jgi:uncharacterized protein
MQDMQAGFNKELLLKSVTMKMPFGKYKDILICDIPINYLEWMIRKDAIPKGELGQLLHTVYQIKMNGLQEILTQLKKLG